MGASSRKPSRYPTGTPNASDRRLLLPAEAYREAQVVGILPACRLDRKSRRGCHRLGRQRHVRRESVIDAQLAIGLRPSPGCAGCALQRQVGLKIHCVPGRETSLRGSRGSDREIADRLHRYRGSEVHEIGQAGVARQRDVGAAWKERIERPKLAITGLAITGGDIELQAKSWLPR